MLGRGPGGAWVYLRFPFAALEVFGRKGQVPVRGTINGFAFRNSLMPRDGIHILGVDKNLQQGAAANVGDTVKVELHLDDATRTVTTPPDLEAALADHPEQANRFAALSYSHKKEYVDWIESAKKPETRANRIQKALELISKGKNPKG